MCDDNERKGEGETRCQLIACSSQKAPRGPPGLTSPSDGRIAINSTICLLHPYCGGVWNLIQAVMYNLAIRKCTSPPLLAPRKICYPAGDRTPDLLNQRQTCHHLSQRDECRPILPLVFSWPVMGIKHCYYIINITKCCFTDSYKEFHLLKPNSSRWH